MDSVSVEEIALADYRRITEKFVREVYLENGLLDAELLKPTVFIMWKEYAEKN